MTLRLPALLLAAISGTNLFAQAPGFSLRIETESGRTEFRQGETLGLKLTFLSGAGPDAWMVSITGRDRSVLGLGSDGFVASPSEGTSDPMRYRLGEGFVYSGLGGGYLRGKPVEALVDLNQWVRFERPGYYRVHGVFHVRPMVPGGVPGRDVALDSNDIGITIVAPGAEWQAEQLARDTAILSAWPVKPDNETFEARMAAARSIGYLDTPESVREAARLVGLIDEQTGRILHNGLRASVHGAEAVAAMKLLLRSPDEPVTPLFLETLTLLEAPDFGERAATSARLRRELADAIGSKRDGAKAISLKTLLDGASQDGVPETSRAEMVRLFAQLPESQQAALLGGQWKQIAGPDMIPALRRLYDSAADTNGAAPPTVAMAVERLYELDPVQGRELILGEIAREVPRLPFRTLAMLPDATLPAMDKILVEHLEHNHPVGELIARYATADILEPVKTHYLRQHSMCEPALTAWFLRVDPAWGERVLLASLAGPGYCRMAIIGQTAGYYAGPEWEKVAVAVLNGNYPVILKADAVRALGQHGSKTSEAAVRETFRYWHEWWKDRKAAEWNEENRRFEQAFIESFAHAKNWSVTAGEWTTVRDLCITPDCKARPEEYQRGRQ